MLNGNSAFVYGNEWVTALISLSDDPTTYCGTIINLNESDLHTPPPITLPATVKWAYHYGSCSWHQVTNEFYDQILLHGKTNRIKSSQPYKLTCSLLQDTLSFEIVSNLGQLGNIELSPEKLGLPQKRLVDFKKPDGTPYAQNDEGDYMVAVNPIGPTWRIIPKNSLIGEPFKDIDGSIRWRPNLAVSLISPKQLKLTGRVAFIGKYGPQYGYNELIDPKPEDFASNLSNYNHHDPLHKAPFPGFYRYHLLHGIWYEMDHESCLAIEKTNRTSTITHYKEGALKYDVTQNQAKTKVNVIEVTGALAKAVNQPQLLLKPDQIVEDDGICLLVDLVNQTKIFNNSTKVNTNSKIAIKKWGWIYGTSELYGYDRVDDFAILDGPPDPDPGYKYCYHLRFQIWFQLTEASYQQVLNAGNIPSSYSPAGCDGPLNLLYPDIVVMLNNPPQLTTFVNPITGKNYQPDDRKNFIVISIGEEWKPIRRDTFVWGPVTLVDEQNTRIDCIEPTTITQFLQDHGIIEPTPKNQTIVNYNRCAFLDRISQAWTTGSLKLDTTNGLPDNFYIPRLRDSKLNPVNLKPTAGYVWAYHLEYKLWYEVDPVSAGRIVGSMTRCSDFTLDFIPDDILLFTTNCLTTDYTLRKSVTDLVILQDGSPIVAQVNQICCSRDLGGYRFSTIGIMVADYTNRTDLYLTNRAAIQYESCFRLGLNTPTLSASQYRIIPIAFPTSLDCCWVYGGHHLWQEVTREAFISILLSTPSKSGSIHEVAPLQSEVTGMGPLTISPDQTTKGNPLVDYYSKNYSEDEKKELTVANLGTLRPESVVQVDDQLLLLLDLVNLHDPVSPVANGAQFNAWFQEPHWVYGVASPDKLDPACFLAKPISLPGNTFLHKYPPQGIYYQFGLDSSVRIALVGLTNDAPANTPPPNIPILNPAETLTVNNAQALVQFQPNTIVAIEVSGAYVLKLAGDITVIPMVKYKRFFLGISIISVSITIVITLLLFLK